MPRTKSIDLTPAFEAIEKSPMLDRLKAFTFKTKTGVVRRYERTASGWLKTWNGVMETDELVVKLVYITAKKDGDILEEVSVNRS